MFDTFRRKPTNLDKAIDTVADMIDDPSLDPSDMDAMITRLERLSKVRKATQPDSTLSADAKLGAFTSLATVAMIVGHERTHVITSKAIGLLQKFK